MDAPVRDLDIKRHALLHKRCAAQRAQPRQTGLRLPSGRAVKHPAAVMG